MPGSAFLAFAGEEGTLGLKMDLSARLGLCTRGRIMLAWPYADRRAQWIGGRRIEDRCCRAGRSGIGNVGANAPKIRAGASCGHRLQCAKPLLSGRHIHLYPQSAMLQLRSAAPVRTPCPHTASRATNRYRCTDSPRRFLSLPLARYLPNAGESGRHTQTPRKFGKGDSWHFCARRLRNYFGVLSRRYDSHDAPPLAHARRRLIEHWLVGE